jgi:hypothetical protein
LLQHFVTGVGMWVHHYEPASKCQSMEWKHVIIQDKEIQKCAFCQQSDVDAQYCSMLEEQLKPTLHSKHRGMLTELFWIMTVFSLIWQQHLLKQFRN